MLVLTVTLAVIALFDSLSMVPLAVIPLTVALGGKRPWTLAGGFVGGISVAYFLAGIALLLGTDFFFKTFGAYLDRLWNQPNAIELTTQILLGLLLMAAALWSRRTRNDRKTPRPAPEPTPGAMFLLGASLVLIGLPGAVPYVAAIEQILRTEPGWVGALSYLAFYNLLFVSPFLLLMGVRYLVPQQSGRFFQMMADFALKAMPRLVVVFFFLLGLVLVADGVGWFLGHPILPVTPPAG